MNQNQPTPEELQANQARMDRMSDTIRMVDQQRPKHRPGKMEDATGAQGGLEKLIRLAGDNADREGMAETPKRFIKAMLELTSGYMEDPKAHLTKNFSLNDVDDDLPFYDEMIISRDIPITSVCEHHMLPFTGFVSMAYIPNPENKRIVGLSKLARMADGYARRFQVQERLTTEIAQAIQTALDPLGVAVVIHAKHTCQCMRGVKKDGSMVTSQMTGVFRKEGNGARQEFLTLLQLGK